jgi:hypothetical protein
MKWPPSVEKYFCTKVQKGLTDKEMVPVMGARYPTFTNWTVHVIRSKRGRLERAGVLKRGLSGSSIKKKLSVVTRRVRSKKVNTVDLWHRGGSHKVFVISDRTFAKVSALCFRNAISA